MKKNIQTTFNLVPNLRIATSIIKSQDCLFHNTWLRSRSEYISNGLQETIPSTNGKLIGMKRF